MKYRHIIGMTLDGTELLADPTFANGCGVDWDCSQGANGTATIIGPGQGHLEVVNSSGGPWAEFTTVAAPIQKGHKYRVTVDIDNWDITFPTDADGNLRPLYLEVFLGGVSTSKTIAVLENLIPPPYVFTFDLWAVENSKLTLRICTHLELPYNANINYIDIASVSLKEFLWNNPSVFDPDITESEMSIKQSELFLGFDLAFVNKIEYFGDAYQYLKTLSINDTVNVKIEYDNAGTWALFKEGLIFISECKWKRNSVECAIEDISELLLRKNKDKKITLEVKIANDWRFLNRNYNLPAQIDSPQVHDIATGAYIPVTIGIYYYWRCVRDIIHDISDGKISLKSATFFNGGTTWPEILGIVDGSSWGSVLGYPAVDNQITYSLMEILRIADSIWNIGSYTVLDSGIYKLKIEPKTVLIGASFTMDKILNENWNYNQMLNISQVRIGYKNDRDYDADWSGNYVVRDVNSEILLDKSLDEVRNSQLVYDARFTSPSSVSASKYYLLEFEVSGGINQTIQFANIDEVTYPYNGDIIETANMNRQTNLLPTYIFQRSDLKAVYIGSSLYYKDYEFESYINFTDFLTILANPYILINLTNSTNNTSGLIEEISWNLKSYVTKIKILGT